MKRLSFALSAAFLSLSLAASPAWAGSIAVNQSGNNAWTIVQQKAGSTKVVTKQIKPRNNARLQQQLSMKVENEGHKQSLLGGQIAAMACGGGYGANNVAVDQYGNGGNAGVAQGGKNNLATVTQGGSNNGAFIIQRGNNHAAHATQTGNGNVTFVTQRC